MQTSTCDVMIFVVEYAGLKAVTGKGYRTRADITKLAEFGLNQIVYTEARALSRQQQQEITIHESTTILN